MVSNPLEGLRESPLFNQLSSEQFANLAGHFKRKNVPAGGAIFIEGMPGEALYLVDKGSVQISKMLSEGDEQVMTTLGPLDLLGEMAVFTGGSRPVSARATQDTVLYSLSRSEYEQLARKNPQLCLQLTRNVIGLFSDRLRSSQDEYRQMLLAALGRTE